MTRAPVDLLIQNANELVTLQGGTRKPFIGKEMEELGIIQNGCVAVKQGRIIAVGETPIIAKRFEAEEKVDAGGKTVIPGFVDPHTHLVFAGSREEEFEMRLKGATYMEILRRGGGILETVEQTRRASEKHLIEDCKKSLGIMLEHGTTTVEAKSGYGLTVKDEIKCLEVLKRLNEEHMVDVVPTFMGAHVIPHEYRDNADKYVKLVADDMIPAVASRRLAEFCDIFCEKGVFDINQSKLILECAKKHGLTPKVHADEMTRLGGTELAAEVGAISADHLLFASKKGLGMMAEHKTVGVLLPASAFSLGIGKYADARRIIGEGVPVALGTDFNPSCWLENQQLTIALACRQMRMTPAEALTAATINAAHAINRAHDVGSLELGKKADILVLDVPKHKFLGYRFGVNLVETVIKQGKIVRKEA